MDDETLKEFIRVFDDEGIFNDDYDGIYIWEPIINKGVRAYLGEKHKNQYQAKAKPKKRLSTEQYYDFYIDVENFTGLDFDADGKLSAREIRRGYFGGSVHDKLISKSKRYDSREERKAFFLGVYYWLHSFEDSKPYASKVDESIFSKNQNIRYNLPNITNPIELKETPQRTAPSFINEETGILTDPEKKRVNTQQRESRVRKRQNKIYASDNQGLIETVAEPVFEKKPSSDFQPPEYCPPQNFDDSMWLSPEHPDAIPFVPRDNEWEQLDSFANSDGDPFKVWAIAAPSGSGKTRLIMEWMRGSKFLQDWRKSILEVTSADKWEEWNPDKPTLIVIDYMFGFDETIQAIIRRCSQTHENPLNHNVRLLVIDRMPLKNIEEMRGVSEFDGLDLDRISHVFYSKFPMNLKETGNQDEIILGVIACILGKHAKDHIVQETADKLRAMESAWHPLFAALLARTVRDGKTYDGTNRRDLIQYYLNYEDRLPWKQPGENGKWASGFISAATVLNGVSFSLLKECVPEDKVTLSEGFSVIRDICKRIVPIGGNDELKPFEPDILGESFFLLFLEVMNDNPHLYKSFIKMLSVGDEKTQANNALELIGFIKMLSQSLCDDKQDHKRTQQHWHLLYSFLEPKKFSGSVLIKWAISAALVQVVRNLQSQKVFNQHPQFLDQVKESSLYNKTLLIPSMICVMDYFEVIQAHNADTKNVISFLEYYDQQILLNKGHNALIYACQNGYKNIAQLLIDNGKNIDQPTTEIGVTPLIAATQNGHETIVKMLIEAGADVNKATTDNGATALMWASVENHIGIAHALINAGADANKVTTDTNKTALVLAHENCNQEIRSLLYKLTEPFSSS